MESEIRNCTGKQLINLSKTLSKLLRHDALNQGIEIRSDGFCKLSDVLKIKMIMKFNPTFDDIMACVNDNNKKRFEIQSLDE
jgi:2'-phosphotransferase